MTTSVHTNQGALIALQNLNATNERLSAVQSRVNTGLKIAGAKDNAAVWAIAQFQRADLAALDSVKESLQRGQSSVDVALSAGESISDLLKNLKALALSASDRNLDQRSRDAIETEFNSIIGQVKQYLKNAEFNGINLLNGSTASYRALANAEGSAAITVSAENLTIPVETTAATAAAAQTGAAAVPATVDLTAATADLSFTIQDDVKRDPITITLKRGAAYTRAEVLAEVNRQLTAADSTITASLSTAAPVNALRFTNSYTGADSRVVLTQETGGTGGTTPSFGITAAIAGTPGTAATRTGGGGIITFGDAVNFTSTYDYKLLIEDLESSIAGVNSALARLGSGSKAMDNHLNFISKLADTITAGVGNLVDADLAKESAALQALQVQQQLGVQALSIANQSPQIVLSLFRGG